MKYYYKILILITFLFFGSKTQEIGNEKISTYNLISHKENDIEDFSKNQEKNEAKNNQRKRKLDDFKPIEIYVDLKGIFDEFDIKNNYRKYLLKDDITSAVNKVKETLNKLINVSSISENL